MLKGYLSYFVIYHTEVEKNRKQKAINKDTLSENG